MKELLKQKMKPETKFILLRASIYLTGFLIVAWVIGMNIWEIKQKTVPLIKVSDNQYIAYTERNYDQAELTLEFEDEVPENLQVEISKDFSVFLTQRKKGVYSEEELHEKLFKNNPTQYPNGSFLKYKKDAYLLEEGNLRKINDFRVLDIFGLEKKNLAEINEKKFLSLPLSDPLTIKSIQENFPQNLLLKKNEEFFIAGFNGYDPLLIANMEILAQKKNYFIYRINTSIKEGGCYKKSDLKTVCQFLMNSRRLGNVYSINLKPGGVKINKATMKLEGSLEIREIHDYAKKMLIK